MSKVDGDEVLIKARVPEGTPEEDIEIYLTDNYGAPTYKLPWELITTPPEAEPSDISFGLRAVATDLLHCFEAWEPTTRVMGNVRARDGADLMRAILNIKTNRTDGHIDQPVECDLKNKGNGELYEIGIRLQGELSAAKNKIFRLESTQRQQFDIARTLQSRINELQKQISSTHDERRKDETAWLVENGGQGEALRYRSMVDGLIEWTPDHNQALRFSRRIDAERFAMHDEDAWRIVEHMWCAPRSPQSPTSGEQS